MRKNPLSPKIFSRFRLGLAFFLVGIIGIYSVNQLLAPSLKQELIAAIAVVFAAYGFILTLSAELQFLWRRLQQLFNSKH